jgi:hypothetical protein
LGLRVQISGFYMLRVKRCLGDACQSITGLLGPEPDSSLTSDPPNLGPLGDTIVPPSRHISHEATGEY